MQFFKYWTRANRSVVGKHGTFDVSCCGYSNESLEDALRLAEQRAESTAKRLANAEQRISILEDRLASEEPNQGEADHGS